MITKRTQKRNWQKRKEYILSKYIAAFTISLLMLTIGILIGTYLNQKKVEAISEINDELKLELLSVELGEDLFFQDSCNANPFFLDETLGKITTKISFLEEQLGKKDKKLIELKKYYSLLQLKHYFLMEKRKTKCDLNLTLILFFYSNEDDSVFDSEKQGYVLDALRAEYSFDKLKIYSFDKDLNLEIIQRLKSKYNISSYPTIIINNNKLSGVHSIEEIKSLILNAS